MNDDKPLLADGFDSAVLGLSRGTLGADIAVYSIDRCIDILVKRDGMSEDEAIEFMNFNVLDAYMGPMTPMFVYEMDAAAINEYADAV
jgi:hypothetical protein|tara:strand:+ start:1488 stop:1751 length:264 start_codon:yes stop_codon:yes gene_type:complete